MSRRIFKSAGGSVTAVRFPDVGGAAAAAVLPAAPQGSEAERRAAAITAEAEAEAAALRQAAAERGRAEAEKLYGEPLLASLTALAGLKASLENAGAAAAAAAEEEIVRLAVAVAGKILRRRLEEDKDWIFLAVSRAVQAVPKGGAMTIKVNEKDYEAIQKAGSLIPEAARLAGGLALEASSEVEPGGCIVVTEAGAVNANISRQLELAEEALLKEARGGL